MRFAFGAGRPVGFFALTLEASTGLDESLACLAWLIHAVSGSQPVLSGLDGHA